MEPAAIIVGAALIAWQATLDHPSALALIGGLALIGWGVYQALDAPRRQAETLRSTVEANLPVLRDVGAPLPPAEWPKTVSLKPVPAAVHVSDDDRDATWKALVGTLKHHAGSSIARKTGFSFGGTGPVLELEARGRLFFLWPARDPQGQAVIAATEAMPVGGDGAPTFYTAAVITGAPVAGSQPVLVRVGTTTTASYPADAAALDAIHHHLCHQPPPAG